MTLGYLVIQKKIQQDRFSFDLQHCAFQICHSNSQNSIYISIKCSNITVISAGCNPSFSDTARPSADLVLNISVLEGRLSHIMSVRMNSLTIKLG